MQVHLVVSMNESWMQEAGHQARFHLLLVTQANEQREEQPVSELAIQN